MQPPDAWADDEEMNVVKNVMFGVLAFAVLSAAPLAAQGMGGENIAATEEGVVWTEDYVGAMKTAAKTKKRIFIEFTATW